MAVAKGAGKSDIPLVDNCTLLGSMVEEFPVCAATKLARSAIAVVDLRSMMTETRDMIADTE